jgi:molecular chaperone DnaK
MSKSIGIDFGSSKCCVADLSPAGAPRVLQNGDNQDFTPAVVCSYKGEIIVGQRALDKAGLAPQETVLSVRALLGLAYSDPAVERIRSRHAFQIVPPGAGDEPRLLLGGQPRSPTEIAALILKKLKEDAAMRLGEPVEQAVITVPAAFTERQRGALRQAAAAAGLRVSKLLEEPLAAAMSLGLDRLPPSEHRRVLVCDLGGEGFEVTLLEVTGGTCLVRHIESDPELGGGGFDRKIIDHVVQHLRGSYGVDPTGDARFMAELRSKAEKAKKDLSNLARTEVTLLGLLKDRTGQPLDVEVPLTRERFQRMMVEEMRRCLKLAETAVARAQLRPEQVDQVVLAGGSSLIPVFRRAMASVFGGSKILPAVDPRKCVAYGAALLAARLEKSPLPVTALDLGLRLPGDRFEVVISAGTPYPTERPVVKGVLTPQANLRRIRLPVYAGRSAKASENQWQATFWIELPPRLPARTPVDVSFHLDCGGVLQVQAGLREGSGRPVQVFADRGEPRGRLEEKLYRTRRAWEAQRTEAQKRFEAAYDRAAEALSGADLASAENALAEIGRLLEVLGGPAPGSRDPRTP